MRVPIIILFFMTLTKKGIKDLRPFTINSFMYGKEQKIYIRSPLTALYVRKILWFMIWRPLSVFR